MDFRNKNREELLSMLAQLQSIALEISHLADYNYDLEQGFDPYFPAPKTEELKRQVDKLLEAFYS